MGDPTTTGRTRVDRAGRAGLRRGRRPALRRGGRLSVVDTGPRLRLRRSGAGTSGKVAARSAPDIRAIGSAVERLVHTEEVTGSIPVSPSPSNPCNARVFLFVRPSRATLRATMLSENWLWAGSEYTPCSHCRVDQLHELIAASERRRTHRAGRCQRPGLKHLDAATGTWRRGQSAVWNRPHISVLARRQLGAVLALVRGQVLGPHLASRDRYQDAVLPSGYRSAPMQRG
jgi:hypothetical protein